VKQNSHLISVQRRYHGFSLIEVMVVIVIIMVVSAMAIFALQPALQSAKADTTMRQVLDQMRQAREFSIANRRYVQITFPLVGGQYRIAMTELNAVPFGPGGANVVLSTMPLQPPSTFYIFPHSADTPDGYGNTASIEFEGTNGGPPGGMAFQSDGTLVDLATFQPINGSLFLGVANEPATARAVTVLGSTGRVRAWRGTGNGATWLQF
jgi:prepilin-type N-terminal cleavage/methylation domain-containing protein